LYRFLGVEIENQLILIEYDLLLDFEDGPGRDCRKPKRGRSKPRASGMLLVEKLDGYRAEFFERLEGSLVQSGISSPNSVHQLWIRARREEIQTFQISAVETEEKINP
jgi:hypothetical protein